MTHHIMTAAICLLVPACGMGLLPAAVRADDAAPPKQAETAAGIPADDAGDERRVIAFLEDHQPELGKALAHLKGRKADEYAKAVAELAPTVTKLGNTKTKDERLYQLELEAWQARTRVDMLVARWMTGRRKDRAALEVKLREAVAAELEVRAKQLGYRKQRSAAWYDRQIERLQDKRDELVTARLKSLLAADDAEKPKATPAEPR
jgi:hypothetical protein